MSNYSRSINSPFNSSMLIIKKAGKGFPAEVKLVRLGCVVGKEKIKLVLIKHYKCTVWLMQSQVFF